MGRAIFLIALVLIVLVAVTFFYVAPAAAGYSKQRATRRAEQRRQQEERWRQSLATNRQRDDALSRISEAFALGQIDPEQCDALSGKALQARTNGELDALVRQLEVVERPK